MQLQVYTSSFLFARVDVEIRSVDMCGNLIRGKETELKLYALDASTLLPVKFEVDGELFCDCISLHIGNGGYLKSGIVFDAKERATREIIFRAAIGQDQLFDSEAVKLIKYRIELQGVNLTDDISKYNGDEGIHYTNNDSARIKVLYKVFDQSGVLADPAELQHFHAEVQSQFLFANLDRIQYVNDCGQLVDITELDCAVKRKNKEEEKIRVSKKVFEEKEREISIGGRNDTVKVSYRLNMFTSHPKLKECNLDGRKYTIELSVLTKYHRPKRVSVKGEEKKKKTEDIIIKQKHIKKERLFIKKEIKQEKQEGLYESDNNNKIIITHDGLSQYIHDMCVI